LTCRRQKWVAKRENLQIVRKAEIQSEAFSEGPVFEKGRGYECLPKPKGKKKKTSFGTGIGRKVNLKANLRLGG